MRQTVNVMTILCNDLYKTEWSVMRQIHPPGPGFVVTVCLSHTDEKEEEKAFLVCIFLNQIRRPCHKMSEPNDRESVSVTSWLFYRLRLLMKIVGAAIPTVSLSSVHPLDRSPFRFCFVLLFL